jgi:hypothetical protein
MKSLIAILSVATFAVAGCTTTQTDRGGASVPVYQGGQYGAPGIGGDGARKLDPWLAGTEAGNRLILVRFDRNRNQRIGTGRARQANTWFRRFADYDRDMRLTDAEISRGLGEVAGTLDRAGRR